MKPSEDTTKQTLVRVFNRSNSMFTHDSYLLKGQSSLDVPEHVARVWCELEEFGKKVVVLGSDIPPTTVSVAEDRKKAEELSQENADLKARIANLEKLAAQASRAAKKQAKPEEALD